MIQKIYICDNCLGAMQEKCTKPLDKGSIIIREGYLFDGTFGTQYSRLINGEYCGIACLVAKIKGGYKSPLWSHYFLEDWLKKFIKQCKKRTIKGGKNEKRI